MGRRPSRGAERDSEGQCTLLLTRPILHSVDRRYMVHENYGALGGVAAALRDVELLAGNLSREAADARRRHHEGQQAMAMDKVVIVGTQTGFRQWNSLSGEAAGW